IYSAGLAYSTTSEGRREFFTQCGNVLSATVITDRFSGQSRGFGFVEMGTAEEAQNSISQFNGRGAVGRRGDVAVRGGDGLRGMTRGPPVPGCPLRRFGGGRGRRSAGRRRLGPVEDALVAA